MTALPAIRWLLSVAAATLLAAGGGAAGCAKPKAVANLPAEGVTVPERAPLPEPAPVPARPTAPAAPAPPVPPPALAVPPPTPPAAVPPRPTPPPVLSPEFGTQEERRLTSQAQSRIDGAERLVAQIDQKKLGRPQQETFSTIQSFIAKAREAMTARDYQRAFTLADKAKVLAEELSQRPR